MSRKKTTFGQRLRELREEFGYTQAELAGYSKSHQAEISKWELGRQEPRLESCRNLIKVFGLHDEELRWFVMGSSR